MMGNAALSSQWSRTYEKIRETHDAAYRAIETAITLEEQEKPHEAIEKYKEGILLIDEALDIRVTCPENPDFTWERASVMIQKMKKTRAEVLMRINSITSSPNFVPKEPPPSYEEATAPSTPVGDSVPRTYTDLAAALNNLQIESSNEPPEVIYSHDNVCLYFISPDGTVTQALEPETLYIAIISGSETTQRIIFLQIGDWIYPLVPGVSPCYRTQFGAFILPDVHSSVAGSTVGIILPPEADAEVHEILENILHGVISQESSLELPSRMRRAVVPEPGVSGTISNGLITGAYYISQGLIKGAQKAGSLVNYGTPKIINSLAPAKEAVLVPPTVSKGFEIASNATSTAAQFTGYVADRVGSATQALGKFLAPHIQKQGTRLLTSGFKLSEEEASSKVDGVLTVAAGAVEGFSTIYRGLEISASILGNNLSNNTVKIVQHRYGDSAGHIATNTFNTVGNVINIGHNSRFFTPKGLVKTAAKETGKAVVEDARISLQRQQQAGLYPSLTSAQLAQISVASTSATKSDEKSSASKEPLQKK